MEDKEPNALHAVSTALSTLDNEIKTNNRDLNSRLMAIESLNYLGYDHGTHIGRDICIHPNIPAQLTIARRDTHCL